jgi:chromosome segregation ATPase
MKIYVERNEEFTGALQRLEIKASVSVDHPGSLTVEDAEVALFNAAFRRLSKVHKDNIEDLEARLADAQGQISVHENSELVRKAEWLELTLKAKNAYIERLEAKHLSHAQEIVALREANQKGGNQVTQLDEEIVGLKRELAIRDETISNLELINSRECAEAVKLSNEIVRLRDDKARLEHAYQVSRKQFQLVWSELSRSYNQVGLFSVQAELDKIAQAHSPTPNETKIA